jgi:hypothetical protein
VDRRRLPSSGFQNENGPGRQGGGSIEIVGRTAKVKLLPPSGEFNKRQAEESLPTSGELRFLNF